MSRYQDYFKTAYCASNSFDVQSTNEDDTKCPISKDEMDAVFPINVATGVRSDVLNQVLDPATSPNQQSALLSQLQKLPSSSPYSQLSDQDKLNLCKLRDVQTFAELKSFADSVQRYIDIHDSIDVEDKTTENASSATSDNTSIVNDGTSDNTSSVN